MKNICIIQARSGSTRLPNKVLKQVNGVTFLEYEIDRIKLAKKINKIVVATTVLKADDRIEELCKKNRIDCFRGSEEDVLGRYYQCSLNYPEFDNIVRLTGDCPLIDPVVIDSVISRHEEQKNDYTSNVLNVTFPDGMDIEIFTRECLAEADKKAKLMSEREHVTQYMIKNKKIKKANFEANNDWSHFRLTVDNSEDLTVIKYLINQASKTAGFMEYISILTKNPAVMLKNIRIKRNEGLLKSLKKDKICK